MEVIQKSNLLWDCYNLTMANAMFVNGSAHQKAVANVVLRKSPVGSNYTSTGGLRFFIELLQNLKPTEADFEYLKQQPIVDETIDAVMNFQKNNTLDILAMPEGTLSFKGEPVMRIHGEAWQVALIEQIANNPFDDLSYIQTNASHLVFAAQGNASFTANAARRYSTLLSAAWAERAAFIGGFDKISWMAGGAAFRSIPVHGTMGHLYIQFKGSSYEAFADMIRGQIAGCKDLEKRMGIKITPTFTLLPDTFNLWKEGFPAAIRAHKEILAPLGYYLNSIRIDSDDTFGVARMMREELDRNGMNKTALVDSNDVTYEKVISIVNSRTPIKGFGSGHATIIHDDGSDLASICKFSAVEHTPGGYTPTCKIAGEKATLPGEFQPYRLYDRNGMFMNDYTALDGENPTPDSIKRLFDINNTDNYKDINPGDISKVRPLYVPIYQKGQLVYDIPESIDVRAYAQQELATLYPEYRIKRGATKITHNLSNKLYNLKKAHIDRSKTLVDGGTMIFKPTSKGRVADRHR